MTGAKQLLLSNGWKDRRMKGKNKDRPVIEAWKVRLRADTGMQAKPLFGRSKYLGVRKLPSLPRLRCLEDEDGEEIRRLQGGYC